VLRGGSFNNNASNVRSANRNNNRPDNRNNNNGFRPASTLRQAVVACLARIRRTYSCGACKCKVQVTVLRRTACGSAE
jgi:hypothetical protein